MTKQIKKVAVIGAGAMGSGIAAQAANAGYEVVLLDLYPGSPQKAIDIMLKAKPGPSAGFMDAKNAKRIETGGTEHDMAKIADADLIIEAVFEDLDVKQSTFKNIYKHAKPDAIIASNTSTIQIEQLTDGMPDDFKARFMNTHFFNPPRFMSLLELIDGPQTNPAQFKLMQDIADVGFGKKVIRCKDTPGFIANRIGGYAIYRAITEGTKQGMNIEDIDSIMSPAFGFTNMGLMKLSDFVGIDIMAHVGTNLENGLAADDHFHTIYEPALVKQLVDNKQLGNKTGGGFYRPKLDDDGNKVKGSNGRPMKQVIDLTSGEYRDAGNSKYFKKNFKKDAGSYAKFFDKSSEASDFAWPVLRDVIVYVMNNAQQMAYDVQSIDEAMQAGYNWKWGPFQLVDEFGVEWFTERLKKDGIAVPELLQKANGRSFYREQNSEKQVLDFSGKYTAFKREDGVMKLEDIKRAKKRIIGNDSASLWDIGDGVVAVEFHTVKGANAIDPAVFEVLNDSIKLVNDSAGKYKAMVIYNEGNHFSVGANLGLIDVFSKAADKVPFAFLRNKAQAKLTNFVDDLVYTGQAVYKALREAPFPVIGAPNGMALGGGCEVLLHCDSVQSGPEVYTGLVEAGVGIIPGWGGCARHLERSQDAAKVNGPMQAMANSALAIAQPMQSISTSGQNAKSKLWFGKDAGISMNSDRVLADAKTRALSMIDGYQAPAEPIYNLPGLSGQASLNMQVDAMYLYGGDPKIAAVNHVDVGVMSCLGNTLSGGDYVTRDQVDSHIAGDGAAYKALINERSDGRIEVNNAMPLTEARILQLERDNFMTLFNRQSTRDRMAFMVAKNKPLREDYPDDRPSPAQIRDEIERKTAKPRSPDGKPLSGEEEDRLRSMSKLSQRTMWGLKKLGLV
tara:strand:+ start:84096 stop:86792 length:2697 start_codon:yes stop_codon:yes gene_type:complete